MLWQVYLLPGAPIGKIEKQNEYDETGEERTPTSL
jgi:hypothetical protein